MKIVLKNRNGKENENNISYYEMLDNIIEKIENNTIELSTIIKVKDKEMSVKTLILCIQNIIDEKIDFFFSKSKLPDESHT